MEDPDGAQTKENHPSWRDGHQFGDSLLRSGFKGRAALKFDDERRVHIATSYEPRAERRTRDTLHSAHFRQESLVIRNFLKGP